MGNWLTKKSLLWIKYFIIAFILNMLTIWIKIITNFNKLAKNIFIGLKNDKPMILHYSLDDFDFDTPVIWIVSIIIILRKCFAELNNDIFGNICIYILHKIVQLTFSGMVLISILVLSVLSVVCDCIQL